MTVPFIQITIVPRTSADENDCLVQISSELFHELLLEKKTELKILLGKKKMKLNLQIVEMDRHELLFPESLYREFCLPIKRYKFIARYKADCHTLYLGPIIGLLTDFHQPETREPHFRSIHSFCEELHHEITERGGFFFVFSYREFSNQGYYFEDRRWTPSPLPLPDVIYNRIHSRRLEHMDNFKTFRQKLGELNIPLFNDRFLSKWEVHEHFTNEDWLSSHIPETRIFSKENLMDFAKRYQTTFIKPIHGSHGRSIFKLINEDNFYTIQTSLKPNAETITDKYTETQIYRHLHPLLNNRSYIIQQGIPLITHEGRTIDFRVLVHKNKQNLWKVTSVVARLSAVNEFVSNIARGGEILTPLTALEMVMSNQKAKAILVQMKVLSLETASIISSKSTGITGELGIDIGVGQDGSLWIIEVNSKPSKNFDDGLMKIRPSAKAIIEFCTKLAVDVVIEKGEN